MGRTWISIGESFRGMALHLPCSPTPCPPLLLGEVAIRHRLGGASYCFMAGADSGLLALWESIKLLEAGECQECVCIMADVLPQHAEMMVRKLDDGGKAMTEYAYAFLLEHNDHAQAHRTFPLARVAVSSNPDGADFLESWKVPGSLIGLLRNGEPNVLFWLLLRLPA